MAYWHSELTKLGLERFGATIGDPMFQAEWELLAILVSLKVVCCKWDPGWVQLVEKTDNKATLQAAMEFKAKSPLMMLLAAEVALELVAQSVEMCWGARVPGVLSRQADALSRVNQGAVVPSTLSECEVLSPCERDNSFFRAWHL